MSKTTFNTMWINVTENLLGMETTFFVQCVQKLYCQDGLLNLSFPTSFKFGSASSAYQIEGAWNVDGKSQNYYDYFTHTYPQFYMNHTGDVACDSYNKYKEDVAILKELGAHFYRFSLSWTRILPSGFANEINDAGVQYYQNLIAELEAAGIEPMVTIFHWDIPMSIHTLGNIFNDQTIDFFAEYADVAFRLFGDKVKYWSTFNEPLTFCQVRYNDVLNYVFDYIPTGFIEYTCGHNLLKAHAKAYRLYQEKYKATQQGYISMNLNAHWSEPASNSTADIEAAERKNQFEIGWWAHPVYHGNYPQVMIDNIARISAIQGFSESRLPVFTAEEIEYIKGTMDYFALNHYSTYLVSDAPYENQTVTKPSFASDREIAHYQDTEWVGDSVWLKMVPWGLRKQLNFIKENYNNPQILITENGFSDNGTSYLTDPHRISYIQEYLNQILLAIDQDGVNVTHHTYWSLHDNFEWTSGYTVKFGLYHVDFDDDNRTRTAKDSARYYSNVIRTRCLLDDGICNQTVAGANTGGGDGGAGGGGSSMMLSSIGVIFINLIWCVFVNLLS